MSNDEFRTLPDSAFASNPPKMTEAQIERESVEAVFCLGGGELDDKPRPYTRRSDGATHESAFLYSYDGVPEYAGEDFPDRDDDTSIYFTAIACFQYGTPLKEIEVKGKAYTLARDYASSGETECTANGCEDDPFEGVLCPLCERAPGEEHGCIYLGDGWGEFVYRHDVAALTDASEKSLFWWNLLYSLFDDL